MSVSSRAQPQPGLTIAGRPIGRDHPPYVIAEIGVNHDGSIDRARSLVDAAAEAGADAVKWQYFDAERLVSEAGPLAAYQKDRGATGARAMLEPLELDRDALAHLLEHAASRNLASIVTVFNIELVEVADELGWAAYKTASPDIVNCPLLDRLAGTGRPLLVSTGAATLDEVVRAASWLRGVDHAFLHCVSAYPTPDEHANLAALRAMQAEPTIAWRAIGYSDHTQSIDTGALAVAAGARLLEKHLTWSRSAEGPDHHASLEPDDLRAYIRLAHRAFAMLGREEKTVGPHERDVRYVARQSLTAARDMPEGHVLQRDDISIRRPANGLEPHRLDDVIGQRLMRACEAGEALTPDHVHNAPNRGTSNVDISDNAHALERPA